jgi:hypothetical protein
MLGAKEIELQYNGNGIKSTISISMSRERQGTLK